MTGGTVDYLAHSGDDLMIVNAARVSFAKWRTQFGNDDKRLLDYLARNNHWTPFAHTSLSVRITAPIFVARQLAKHQIGLVWNEISRRYVDDAPSFHQPKIWRSRPVVNIKQGSGDVLSVEDNERALDIYYYLLNAVDDAYGELLALGVCPEQARMVLPLATLTTWIWTGSLAAYARICHLRLHDHAQAETREIAERLSGICATHYPHAWDALREAGQWTTAP